MTCPEVFRNLLRRSDRQTLLIAAIAFAFAFAAFVHAQTFSVIHSFTGAGDGAMPQSGLTMDRNGNLYGTAALGGNSNNDYCAPTCGTVFKMSLKHGQWTFLPLYQFHGTDGGGPDSRPVFAPNGVLYGTAGLVYSLRPPPTSCSSLVCLWSETVEYQFCCGLSSPGGLTFDEAGNIYGASPDGGIVNHCSGGVGCGFVFELLPTQSGWLQVNLYRFVDGSDGAHPMGGVIFDNAGNLYGTTAGLYGGDGTGSIFELTPGSGGWTKQTLYSFRGQSDGYYPVAGLISDQQGNFYGAAANGGTGNGGTVFQFAHSGSGWNFNLLNSLNGSGAWQGGPIRDLVMDSAGNLYGTTSHEGLYSMGSVFKLTQSNGSWIYTTLHDFTGGTDGGYPMGNLVIDSSGNVFGTASAGGVEGRNCPDYNNYQCGVVFEITP